MKPYQALIRTVTVITTSNLQHVALFLLLMPRPTSTGKIIWVTSTMYVQLWLMPVSILRNQAEAQPTSNSLSMITTLKVTGTTTRKLSVLFTGSDYGKRTVILR